MKEIKNRIQALARKTGLTDRASVSDFRDWRAAERASEMAELGEPTSREQTEGVGPPP